MFFDIYDETEMLNEDLNLMNEEENYEDINFYAESLEAIVEFNEEYSILKDKMMIAEHKAILAENALLLEEEKKGFGSKVKALVDWFIGKIRELYGRFRDFLKSLSSKTKAKFTSKKSAKEAVAAADKDEKKEAPLALAAPSKNLVYSTNAIKDLLNNLKACVGSAKLNKFESSDQVDAEDSKISSIIDKCKTSMKPLESSKGNISQKAEQLAKIMQPLAKEALAVEKDLEKVQATANSIEVAGRNANSNSANLVSNFKKFLNTLAKGAGFSIEATKHNINVANKLVPTGFTMK